MRVLALAASLLILTLNSSIAATVSCMFMTETSISKTGEWLEKEEDFMKLLGLDIENLTGVAIMTDTDNSKLKAVSYYQDIFFSAK